PDGVAPALPGTPAPPDAGPGAVDDDELQAITPTPTPRQRQMIRDERRSEGISHRGYPRAPPRLIQRRRESLAPVVDAFSWNGSRPGSSRFRMAATSSWCPRMSPAPPA